MFKHLHLSFKCPPTLRLIPPKRLPSYNPTHPNSHNCSGPVFYQTYYQNHPLPNHSPTDCNPPNERSIKILYVFLHLPRSLQRLFPCQTGSQRWLQYHESPAQLDLHPGSCFYSLCACQVIRMVIL
jgi:hypothetical protein